MEPTPDPLSPLQRARASQKKYRDANKDRIKERAQDKKYWRKYYETNKEKIREKNLARYYSNLGLIKENDAPATNDAVHKLEGLLKELRDLVPLALRKKQPEPKE